MKLKNFNYFAAFLTPIWAIKYRAWPVLVAYISTICLAIALNFNLYTIPFLFVMGFFYEGMSYSFEDVCRANKDREEYTSIIQNEKRTVRRKRVDNSEVICPVCGYYCLGKGGYGCIDKPSM